MLVAPYTERPDLAERTDEIGDVWPEFVHHARLNRHWHRLREDYLDFQLVLYDEDTDALVGRGHSIPFPWDGSWADLPDGVEGVFDRVFEEGGGAPTTLSAVAAVVDPRHQGRGLSGLVIEGMRAAAARAGLEALVAPVRPTLKARYPLAPMERYLTWRRSDGELFDPWLRVHERLGAEILGVCLGSLLVTGTVAEWEEWTGMAFPDTGSYVVEDALVPVEIDRDADVGRYVEPNVWMRHPV
jgi:GNAT superfamily N-acetyltransferase